MKNFRQWPSYRKKRKTSKSWTKMTVEEAVYLVDLYRKGMRINKICEEIGCSRRTVKLTIEKQNVPRRKSGWTVVRGTDYGAVV